MSKHTPTPWHVAYYASTQEGGSSHYSLKHGERTIVRTPGQVATELDEENVRLIGRAVNSHAALLEALKRCLPWLRKAMAEGVHRGTAMPADLPEGYQQAVAAIEAAEGRDA